MRWPRLNLPTDRRIRLISVAGSALLVVLIATTAAVLLNSGEPGGPSAAENGDPLGLQTAAQSGLPVSPTSPQVRPSISVPPAPTASPLAETPARAASASYKTIALLGLGGFDTEVTVSNPGRTSWKVLLTLPEDKPVENRSGSLVKMAQDGTTVTLTPVSASAEQVTFTVRFPALLALGKSITACTIDGKTCSAS
jgi:hypothetical protein